MEGVENIHTSYIYRSKFDQLSLLMNMFHLIFFICEWCGLTESYMLELYL